MNVAYGSAVIFGVGLSTSGASSFPLGAPGAHAILMGTATDWWIISGQQDTGWVTLTYASGVGAAPGFFTPAARLQGDRVVLKGCMKATGSAIPNGTTWATVPSSAIPSVSVPIFPTYQLGSGVPWEAGLVDTSGHITSDNTLGFLGVDGVTYTLA